MINKVYKSDFIDLHIHSNNSDGTLSPKEIINLADCNRTNFISICDHDSVSGMAEFQHNIRDHMIGVKGIEFSSYIMLNNQKVKIHILGYGFDENNLEFIKLLNELKDKRIKAHIEVLNIFKEKLKQLPELSIFQLNFEKYCWFDREIIGCLQKENYSEQIIDYYKQYFKTNRFSYGVDYELNVERVIDVLHDSGGLAVLAHPMSYKLNKDNISTMIKKLVDFGIDGVEIYQSDCNIEDSMFLKKLTDKYSLLYSVGSDFHKIISSDNRTIGTGIDNNLCINSTSLTNEILNKQKFLLKSK